MDLYQFYILSCEMIDLWSSHMLELSFAQMHTTQPTAASFVCSRSDQTLAAQTKNFSHNPIVTFANVMLVTCSLNSSLFVFWLRAREVCEVKICICRFTDWQIVLIFCVACLCFVTFASTFGQ